MKLIRSVSYLRPANTFRMIFSGSKPEVVKEEKKRTLMEKLEEEQTIPEVDRGRGMLHFIAESIEDIVPDNPHQNWVHCQVSACFRDKRYADAIRVFINMKILNKLVDRQDYVPAREENLGADLAAAHFLLQLGAAVKFTGQEKYITKNSIFVNNLPLTYDSSFKLEAIKLNSAEIFDNGYKSLRNLTNVKHFDASDSIFFSDAQLDRLFCQFGTTLESIDVSNCNRLTSSGLTSLARFRKLKHVKAEGMEHVSHLEFLCLLLKESNENLNITGVSQTLFEENKNPSDTNETNGDRETTLNNTSKSII